MDLPTIAQSLGRIEQKLDDYKEDIQSTQDSLSSAYKRIDNAEKWQAHATGALSVWGVAFAAFVAWVRIKIGR